MCLRLYVHYLIYIYDLLSMKLDSELVFHYWDEYKLKFITKSTD